MHILQLLSSIVLLHQVYGTTPGKDHYPPKFIDRIDPEVTVSGHIGKNVRLMCRTESNPRPFTSWFKGEEVLEKSRRFRIYKNYMLIKKFSPVDAGLYRCEARNPFGGVSREFQVEATEAPEEDIGFIERHNEDFTSLKRQIDNLNKRVDAYSRNQVHLHFTGGERGEKGDNNLDDGQHIFLNILTNEQKHKRENLDRELHGHCQMLPNSVSPGHGMIKGNIHLKQQINGSVIVDIHLSGFEMKEGSSHTHGLAVHHNGDLSNGCDSLGPHYYPKPVSDKPGDNHRHHNTRRKIFCDDKGEVHMTYTDNALSLHGKYSILGRGFVIHDRTEMKRMACCVIGRTDSYMLDKMEHKRIHFTEQLLEYNKSPTPKTSDDNTFYN